MVKDLLTNMERLELYVEGMSQEERTRRPVLGVVGSLTTGYGGGVPSERWV